AVQLLQYEAPLTVLGKFPAPPRLDRQMVVAVAEGDVEAECTRLERLIDAAQVSLTLHPKLPDRTGERIIEFYLDGPGFPTWRPVAELSGDLVFNFPPAPPLALGT